MDIGNTLSICPAENNDKIHHSNTWFFTYIKNQIVKHFSKKRVQPANLINSHPEKDNSENITTYVRSLFHDFRTPLNNISLSVDTLMYKVDAASEDYNELLCIHNSCSLLTELLDGFLLINAFKPMNTQTLTLTLEPFNIVGLIKKIKYIFLFNTRNTDVIINYNIGTMQEWVIGDSKLIQMVLIKLISNAINNSEGETNISVNMLLVEAMGDKQRISITVIDDNKQIETNVREDVFNKHNTHLHICKNIVELHGGSIHYRYNNVRSREEIVNAKDARMSEKKRNIFRIELIMDTCPSSEYEIKKIISSRKYPTNVPFVSCIEAPESLEKSANTMVTMMNFNRRRGSNKSVNSIETKRDSNRINILVIDDSEISRKLMQKLIDAACANTKVYTAVDGLDALIQFIKFSESKLMVHMILVDNVMPNLTGELLCKILRGLGYNGLILGVTGNGVKEDRDKFRENGADYVFIKPFTKNNLESILDLVNRVGYLSWYNHKLEESVQGRLEWVEDI